MQRSLVIAALGATLLVTSAAAGQGSVEECVANNEPRYSTPDDATTHQYVDTGGLCADAQDDETEVNITPIGGKKPPKAKPRPRTQTQPAATPAPTPAPEPAPPVSSPSRPETQPATTTTAPPKAPKPATPAPATPAADESGARGAAATRAVTTALRSAEAERSISTPAGLASVPGGIVGAALLALGLAGAGIGMRRIGRR